MNHLTDAEVLAIREAAFREAAKYSQNLQRKVEELEYELSVEVAARRYAEERVRILVERHG